MRQGIFSLFGLCLMMVCVAAGATQVSASVDRNTVHMGDTLTLSITVTNSAQSDAPDLSPLHNDFNVQQTSNSRNISVINGTATKTVVWGVALQPLHPGTITIPPVDVSGGQTQAISITVLPAAAGAQGGPGDDAFVEASVQPLSVYVGQQALYRVRLFYADGLAAQGSLQAPNIAGVDLQQLGKDNQFRTQRGGRSYNVVERDYALTVHTPGTITLPALSFRGQLGRGGGFPGFATDVHNVNLLSPSLSLQVKPKPAAATSGAWLPAQNVTLTASGLPADGKAHAGDPITLTLTEKAKGLPFEDMPELTLPDVVGAQVYPDKPETSTDNDGQWLHGKRQRSFAIVPTRAGELTIPSITLHWWNVDTDTPEVITLPAQTLTVAAAAGSAPPTPPPAAPAASDANTPTPAQGAAAPSATAGDGSRWRWAALGLLVLWLGTLLAWWRRAGSMALKPRSVPDGSQPDLGARNARTAFRHALDAGDDAAVGRALLAWARAEKPDLYNLGAVGAALADTAQRHAITTLERSRYGCESIAPDRTVIGKAFAKGFVWRAPDHRTTADAGLPPLYPFGGSGKHAD